MQIYFIRHGQSTNNLLWETTEDYHSERVTDPELTDSGQQQAQCLAAQLTREFTPGEIHADYRNDKGFGLTHVYASLMVRAIDTAMPTAQALGLPLHTLPTIHEYGGIFRFEGIETRIGEAGLTKDELLARYPNLRIEHDVAEAGWWNNRVEDSAELYRRAGETLAYLLETHDKEDRVAFVSHGGFYQAFMAHVLGLSPDPGYPDKTRKLGFAINNTAITRIVTHGHGLSILYMNNTSHLPVKLVTR